MIKLWDVCHKFWQKVILFWKACDQFFSSFFLWSILLHHDDQAMPHVAQPHLLCKSLYLKIIIFKCWDSNPVKASPSLQVSWLKTPAGWSCWEDRWKPSTLFFKFSIKGGPFLFTRFFCFAVIDIYWCSIAARFWCLCWCLWKFHNIEAKISMLAVLVRESCRDLLCVYGKALNQKKIYLPYIWNLMIVAEQPLLFTWHLLLAAQQSPLQLLNIWKWRSSNFC